MTDILLAKDVYLRWDNKCYFISLFSVPQIDVWFRRKYLREYGLLCRHVLKFVITIVISSKNSGSKLHMTLLHIVNKTDYIWTLGETDSRANPPGILERQTGVKLAMQLGYFDNAKMKMVVLVCLHYKNMRANKISDSPKVIWRQLKSRLSKCQILGSRGIVNGTNKEA